MIRSALAVPLLLLAAEVHANEVRLSGQLSDSLRITLKLTLNSSNPLCWGKTQVVEPTTTSDAGQYGIDAKWDGGFCGYHSGFAEVAITHTTEENTKLQALFGTSSDGYTEFHDVVSLHCGDDPEFGQFGCAAVRKDASSVVGTNFYFDPDKTGAEYHFDVLAD